MGFVQTKHILNISLCAVLLALLALSVLPPDAAFAQAGSAVAQAGSTVYDTLAVKRLTGDFTYHPPQTASSNTAGSDASGGSNHSANSDNPAAIPTPTLNPDGVVASTPGEDGSIAHVIKYGETLIQIADAYGISLADLESMNKLDPKNPQYFAGQALIIRPAFTLTPYYTATYTPKPPTRTPQPSRTPRPTRTATGAHTPVPTRTNTPEPLVQLPTLEDLGPGRSIMAYSFIAISAVGLLVLVLTSFMPGRKE